MYWAVRAGWAACLQDFSLTGSPSFEGRTTKISSYESRWCWGRRACTTFSESTVRITCRLFVVRKLSIDEGKQQSTNMFGVGGMQGLHGPQDVSHKGLLARDDNKSRHVSGNLLPSSPWCVSAASFIRHDVNISCILNRYTRCAPRRRFIGLPPYATRSHNHPHTFPCSVLGHITAPPHVYQTLSWSRDCWTC